MDDNISNLKGPLEGMVVLDLSRILAGPFATQMLGDFGADVIKVERPNQGDDTRQWGPPYSFSQDGKHQQSAYFQSANRNKKSITIDLKNPRGVALIKELVKRADVLVENYKVGDLSQYGLGYEELAKLNPKLVFCSISGFGQSGPYAANPGYDFIIQAMGGLMSITGSAAEGDTPQPTKTGVAVADLFTGLYAANAVLAAVLHAQRTGEGQHIDLALLDCQMAMLANQGLNHLVSGATPRPMGNAHPNIVPYETLSTKDGTIAVAVGNDSQFRTFCKALGVAAIEQNPQYKTNALRVENREDLIKKINATTRKLSSEALLELLTHARVPCGAVRTIDEVFADPHVEARQMIVEQTSAEGLTQRTIGNPVKFSKTSVTYRKPPPQLGIDTHEILERVLNLSADEIHKLVKDRVI